MKLRSSVCVFLACLGLVGCAPGMLNINTERDMGPMPVRYEATILAYLRETLKDPMSLQDFSVQPPVFGRCSIGIYGPFFGWAVQAQYNAKNAYGGYVGRRQYIFWFHGERLKGMNDSMTSCNMASGWK